MFNKSKQISMLQDSTSVANRCETMDAGNHSKNMAHGKNRTSAKVFSFILAVALSVGCAQAQFSIGARGGLGLTGMNVSSDGTAATFADGKRPNLGYRLGLVAEYAFNTKAGEAYAQKGWSVQPGVMIASQGFKQKRSLGALGKINDRISLTYLSIPVYAKYNWLDEHGSGVYVKFGTYLGFALSGKINDRERNEETKLEFGDDKVLKSSDFGIGFGLGTRFGNMGIGYETTLGFPNIRNSEYLTWSNTSYVFTFSYWFGR